MQEEYCVEIKRNKRAICNEPDCNKDAKGKTDKCIGHGGGVRCNEPDCKVSARGKTNKCAAHGGGWGKRCNEPDCKINAAGKTDKCPAHGGGKRCNEVDCKTRATGGYDKCIAHGGGRRCNEADCKSSAAGKTDKCGAALASEVRELSDKWIDEHKDDAQFQPKGMSISAKTKAEKAFEKALKTLEKRLCGERGLKYKKYVDGEYDDASGGARMIPTAVEDDAMNLIAIKAPQAKLTNAPSMAAESGVMNLIVKQVP